MFSTSLRPLLAGTALAVALVGVVPSAASAQTEAADTSESAKTAAPWAEHRRAKAERLAELIGITPEELRAGFEEGLSAAEIAEANGLSSDELADLIVADITDHIETALAEGRIDEDQAERRLEHVEEFVDRSIDLDRDERRELAAERLERRSERLEHRQDRIGDRVDRLTEGD